MRVGCILGLDQIERGIELGQHVLQRFLYQRMIVDHEYLHRAPQDVKISCGPSAACPYSSCVARDVNCRK
jgi:hypothetical protein